MSKNIRAFTMAETILVMTILGIIGAVMISAFKPSEFKEGAMKTLTKKVLSEIDTATNQILMNNTADGTFDTLYKPGTSELMSISTSSYDENSNHALNLYKSYLVSSRKKPSARLYTSAGSSMLLKDGATFQILLVPSLHFDIIFPDELTLQKGARPDLGVLWFDINDNEPPNIWGKDRFALPLSSEGIDYDFEL